ncbi:MAG: hypothetical protein WAV27_25070 [Xanthobacteraceae bacterium]
MSDLSIWLGLSFFGGPPSHLLPKQHPSISCCIGGNNGALKSLFQALDVGYLGMPKQKLLEEGVRFGCTPKLSLDLGSPGGWNFV